MRVRRHGSADIIRKTEPKLQRDAEFKDWSPRALARYTEAMRAMVLAPQEKRLDAIPAATRPHGSLNVARLTELALILLRMYGFESLYCSACGASVNDE